MYVDVYQDGVILWSIAPEVIVALIQLAHLTISLYFEKDDDKPLEP